MQDRRSELVIPQGSIPTPDSLYTAIQTICEKADTPVYSRPFHTLQKKCETDWLDKCPVFDVCSWLGPDSSVEAEYSHKTKDDVFETIFGNVTDEKVPKNAPEKTQEFDSLYKTL